MMNKIIYILHQREYIIIKSTYILINQLKVLNIRINIKLGRISKDNVNEF